MGRGAPPILEKLHGGDITVLSPKVSICVYTFTGHATRASPSHQGKCVPPPMQQSQKKTLSCPVCCQAVHSVVSGEKQTKGAPSRHKEGICMGMGVPKEAIAVA